MNDQLVLVQNRIISISKSWIGQEEIQPNKGFKDPDFEAFIMTSDWIAPDPWCAALAIATWLKAYEDSPVLLARIKKLISLNSQQMGRNFHTDPIWPTSTTEIIPGSMIIYAEGDSYTSGHTEVDVDDPQITPSTTSGFKVVAGNTIPAGNPGNMREGYIVATHNHILGQPHSTLGLNFVRAIHPLPLDYQF